MIDPEQMVTMGQLRREGVPSRCRDRRRADTKEVKMFLIEFSRNRPTPNSTACAGFPSGFGAVAVPLHHSLLVLLEDVPRPSFGAGRVCGRPTRARGCPAPPPYPNPPPPPPCPNPGVSPPAAPAPEGFAHVFCTGVRPPARSLPRARRRSLCERRCRARRRRAASAGRDEGPRGREVRPCDAPSCRRIESARRCPRGRIGPRAPRRRGPRSPRASAALMKNPPLASVFFFRRGPAALRENLSSLAACFAKKFHRSQRIRGGGFLRVRRAAAVAAAAADVRRGAQGRPTDAPESHEPAPRGGGDPSRFLRRVLGSTAQTFLSPKRPSSASRRRRASAIARARGGAPGGGASGGSIDAGAGASHPLGFATRRAAGGGGGGRRRRRRRRRVCRPLAPLRAPLRPSANRLLCGGGGAAAGRRRAAAVSPPVVVAPSPLAARCASSIFIS